jgi:hypothetical protein
VKLLTSESKPQVPEPKMTPEGYYECPQDKTIYTSRKEYEEHCKQAHQK